VANESQVLKVVPATAGKIPTAEVSLVNAAGAPLPAASIPALPTSNGQYVLNVASGVYTWVAAT